MRLKAAIDDAKEGQGQAGILELDGVEGGGDYESATDAAPEEGVFQIVGGYVATDGEKTELYNRVHVRSIGGHEEDLLGNDATSLIERMEMLMANCLLSISTEEGKSITEPSKLREVVRNLPSGSRTHLLISIRRTTHWRRTKDHYDMIVCCPRHRTCGKEQQYTVNLGELETFESPDPTARIHDLLLRDSNIQVTWRVMLGPQDELLTALSNITEIDHEILTYMIVVRLAQWGDHDVRLGMADFFNEKKTKLKLSSRAKAVVQAVKSLSSGDREDFREAFLEHEPGIDIDLEFECKHCKTEFNGVLDVGQKTFFFPSASSRRSKRKSST
jgi:hypothetical protein